MFDIENKRLNLIVAPVDMRKGYESLSSLCYNSYDIDLRKEEDLVVFISRNRRAAKIVGFDGTGGFVINKKLSSGKFQKVIAVIEQHNGLFTELTKTQLLTYIFGGTIFSK